MSVTMQGWLSKEGGSIKSWKRRFFVLKDGNIIYYKQEGDKEALGSISITSSVNIKAAERKGKKNYFEIITSSKVFCLCADKPEERDAWVAALQKEKEKNSGVVKGEKVSVEDFDLLNLVGKGSFGKVMQVRKKSNGKIYAMKVLDKKHILDHNEVEHTLAEKNILQRIVHPFLVNLNWSFQTADKLYFILDFVNGGELFYHLQREKKFPEERVRFYAAEILLALEHLHENGIIYRDLKPENLLLTEEGHICLTDFGLCKEGINSEDDRTITFCGTPEYLAPEVLKGKGYGKAVDWWSYGSLVYEMLCGLPPFYSQDIQEMYRKIMTEKLKFPPTVGADARDMLERLLQRDIELRLKDPEKIKAHPFFKQINWDALYNKRVKPPYVPSVSGPDDIRHIDETFTSEMPTLTPSDPTAIDVSEQENFEGFTYVKESTSP
jgi:serine/threonine protein kinase